MADANLQRERILPSEKAVVYKMKLEVLNILFGQVQLAELKDRSLRKLIIYKTF